MRSPPLIYTGDPQSSLDSLHRDVVSQYRNLNTALGEHECGDLTVEPPSLLGASYSHHHQSLALPMSFHSASQPMLRLPYADAYDAMGSSPSALGEAAPRSFLTGSGVSDYVKPAPLGLLGYQSKLSDQRQSSLLGGYGHGSGGELHGPRAFGSGFRNVAASAPLSLGPSWGVGGATGGIRPSAFTLTSGQKFGRDPDSQLSFEESRLLYPPVGSTFDGHASRSVQELRAPSTGIDTLSDLKYRRPRPLQYDDMLQGECLVHSLWVLAIN